MYLRSVQKNVPHHPLSGVQAKFVGVENLEITSSAIRSANAIGYSLEDVVDVVQALEKNDFVKSETQHSLQIREFGTIHTRPQWMECGCI